MFYYRQHKNKQEQKKERSQIQTLHLFPRSSQPPLFEKLLASGVNVNPTLIPMPSRKLPIAIAAPMLHILQPSNTKGNTAQASDGTETQGPSTAEGVKKQKKSNDQLFWGFLDEEEEEVEGDVVRRQTKTHHVYAPDTFFVLLTVRR